MSVPGPATVDDWVVDEIKDALRRAPDLPSLNACATHYAAKIAVLKKSPIREHRTQAIIINNLIVSRRQFLFRGRHK